ncbi:MAG: DUF4097 domain-containing protein [Candidatus Cloacimonetes bacterium]|nr:DUF4097 domain-containing protein [Candidatus Cloacimonadota bacterium]
MKIALMLIWAGAIIFGLFACYVSVDTQGKSVVNNVVLEYENSTIVQQGYDLDQMMIDVSSGNVGLKGIPQKDITLKVSYMEYKPGDARIVFKNGELTYETKSGKPALITGIAGTIPQDIALTVDTGSGNVSIADMRSNKNLVLDSGSGSVTISDCQLQELVADTGSGDVALRESSVRTLVADTGSGDVTVSNSRITNAEIDTGSGNIRLIGSEIISREFDTGSGKIIEEGMYSNSDKKAL